MEIPNISIPEIKIDIPLHTPYQVLNVPLPSIKLPGCVRYHRDASPKNTALYNDDPTGTMISCPYGSMPTFQPMLYDRRRINIVESKEQEKRQETDETIIIYNFCSCTMTITVYVYHLYAFLFLSIVSTLLCACSFSKLSKTILRHTS